VIQIAVKLYQLMIQAANSLQSPLLLLIRLYWGWQFTQTGWGKVQDLGKVTDFFTSLGIPAPALNAYFVSGLELVGGVLLAIGLGSRFISLLFVGDMLVAYVSADREALMSVLSDPGKFYNAAPFTFLLASALVLAFGPGRFSLDALLAGRWGKAEEEPDRRPAVA
jgi:putative oxidoreductase